MAAETLREHLTTFGLSEKEVEVYLGILRVGKATTGEIADAADVSQGYVYEVVGTLSDRGLVTIDESKRPTVIHARPPEEALEDLVYRLDELEEAIAEAYADTTETAGFEIVHSRSTVRRRARSHIEAAENELVLALPATEFEHVADALADAVDRGVFVYLLLAAPDIEPTLSSIDDPSKYTHVLRTWDARPPVFVIADEARGVMGSHGVLSGRHGEESALSFSQPEVGTGFFGNLISNVWPMGTTRYLTEPDPLPHTYDHVRTAITNAALYRAAGRELAADLVVSDIDTGTKETFQDVPIVDVRQSLVGESTAAFPMENSLVFEVGGERRAVGNSGGGLEPFLEAYGGIEVTLKERSP